jgi:lipopolysaccharide export LptBFGC system permease protein LptF
VSRTLTCVLLREVLAYSVVGGGAITLLFLAGNVPRHLPSLLVIGFDGAELLGLFGTLAGVVGTYVAPIAFLFGVLITLGRMTADREVLGMQVCGLGLPALLVPVLGMALAIALLTAALAHHVEWRARREMRALTKSLTTRGTTPEPGQFLRLGERVIYARDRGVEGHLRGVMISDQTDPARPLLILAEQGSFGYDEASGEFRFELERGEVHVEPPRGGGDEYQRVSFARLHYAFDASAFFAVPDFTLRPYDMPGAELRAILAAAAAGASLEGRAQSQPVHYELELQRRWALPLASLPFALVGVPLGIRVRRGARSWGALLCTALALLYYLISSFGRQLALDGALAPAAAMWAPNAIFTLLAAGLLLRTRSLNA